MTSLLRINLIQLMTFYLGVMFLLSLWIRASQYMSVLRLITNAGRWPKLRRLVTQFRHIFLTWETFLPAILAILLMAINFTASRVLFPRVTLTPRDLFTYWGALFIVVPLGGSMLAYDFYVTFMQVGEVDSAMLEGYFDQAERWLGGWTQTPVGGSWLLTRLVPWAAYLMPVVTLGWVNPRDMVAAEVRTALLEATKLINTSLWQVSVQVALRFSFGLSLWLIYAFTAA